MKNAITNEQLRAYLYNYRILPMFTVDTEADIEVVRSVLKAVKIKLVEVVLRSETAMKAIRILSADPEIIVAAGTVRSVAQATEAIKNGAQFIITPAIIPSVMEFCNQQNIVCICGIATPSEIEQAYALKAEILKFFPAGNFGGVSTLKAYAGPYPDALFVPTGGVNEDNYLEYVKQKNVLAVGGSFILSSKLVKTRDVQALTDYLLNIREKIRSNNP